MTRSEELFARALRVIPGGVNSPVRAFKAVGGNPPFIVWGEGSHVRDAALSGTSYGAPCPAEVELAERVVRSMPSIEKVRFVSSGTEAAMSALRLARGFSGRNKILKFEGCYHGHADSLLVAAGSGVATLGIPGSPGVPAGTVADTLTAPYNDLRAVEEVVSVHGRDLAAVIVEPVAGNMGCVLPASGYLEGLRDITRRAGALLVFDEVITGFRLGLGGAQAQYGVTPDLTCLGKIIGGGLPVGAYGGRADIMGRVAPEGPVYQAGTLSGNPLAMAAGCAALDALRRPGAYERLSALTARLVEGLAAAAKGARAEITINRVASMFTVFFCPGPVTDYGSAKASDTARFARFFRGMLRRGVYLPPAQFEAAFVSLAHTELDVDTTVRAAREAFAE